MELIGRRFGHIRVTGVAGEGGMGEVYAGFDEKLERKVALKVLHAEHRLDATARERLLREARALSRLEHRHICRIYDYVQSDDFDVLVLEFIDGRTLTDMLGQAMPRGEKLRIAIAVAEVLVAAHRTGIIHRDLKPDNVMLTRDGDVKVLDFGLARLFEMARGRSSDRRRAVGQAVPLREAGSAPHATEAGIALGTPLYMSPEQARGETLTPATDMYSFGLLLQALFTGSDPHPENLTGREVMLRAARGETLPVTGVARDVAALIHRLKQIAPADRPTAIETVERLRHLADKPRRIARDAAAVAVAALLAAGGWRYTVDLQRERAIALHAQGEAERRRAQAEDLIEFMLGDLRQKLEPVGRLDILDDVGRRAMEYVQSLDPATMSADELTRSAKALNQLGDVRLAQGNAPEALRMFRQAEKLTAEAVRREPRNGAALLVHGATEFWIGHVLWTQGRYDEALPRMQAYMEVGETLARIDPRRGEYLLERAYGHSAVALILEAKGDLHGALAHYRVSLEVKQDLARRDPDDANAQAEVARAVNKVGAVLYKMRDLRAAIDYSRREVEIYRQLVRRQPKQALWKQRLATSMAYLGRALDETGDHDAAFALWQEELAIEREQAALDPTNVNWQRDLAITTRRLALGYQRRGDRERAETLFADASARIGEVVAAAPTNTGFAVDAALIRTDYGAFLGGERGERMLRDTIRSLEGLPPSTTTRYAVAAATFRLSEILRRSDPAAADAALARAARDLEPLVGDLSPFQLATWTRVLIARGRGADARAVIARLQTNGYSTRELERLCAESGCSEDEHEKGEAHGVKHD